MILRLNFHLECCKDMKNFNSMFAIISGLDHKTVQRLQATWERVPEKYKKLFEVSFKNKSFMTLIDIYFLFRNLNLYLTYLEICLSIEIY